MGLCERPRLAVPLIERSGRPPWVALVWSVFARVPLLIAVDAPVAVDQRVPLDGCDEAGVLQGNEISAGLLSNRRT